MQNIPIAIFYQGMLLSGFATPVQQGKEKLSLKIVIQGWSLGTLSKQNDSWLIDQPIDPAFVHMLGKYIDDYVSDLKVVH